MQSIKSPAGKPIFPFCTKAGNSPYNKGGVFAQVEPERIVGQYNYKGGKLVILRPVIDKLIFEYAFKGCGSHKRAIQDVVLENAKKILDDASLPFKLATAQNVGGDRFYYLQKQYKHNYVLVYKPNGAKIIIQLKANKKGAAFMRCDLNPARLQAKGMTFFRESLNKLLANNSKVITFEAIAKAVKSIKRIDIAVDMIGVDASDLEGRYVYKNKELKKTPVQNPTGRTETMYFVMPENDKNQAYWYNKRQWYKDIAKDPLDGGQQSPYGQALYTRFEYRIQETDKPIAKLHSMLNHLPKVAFRAIDYSKIEGKDYTHALFLRYALQRTKEKALEMIPDDLKPKYAVSYDKAIVNIWKPDVIWDKGWHTELISLGLLTPEVSQKSKGYKKKASKKKG